MALSLRHPEISIQMSRIIALRTHHHHHHHHQQSSEASVSPTRSILPQGGQGDFGRNNINLKTIALLPISADVPISQFAKRLNEALENVGATALRLDHTTVTSVLGRHAFSKLGKLKLMHWLAEQEENYRIVLYVADSGVTSPWTQRCIRQVSKH
jgi:lysophospholipid hydrolase